METADVIVIGGGPAGSTCAWRLTAAGARVVLIDAATFPRDKVCAGWITPDVMRALQFDVPAYAAEHVFQPLTGFRVGAVGSAEAIVVDYGTAVSAGIRRREFDDWLLRRSGASVVEGTAVRSLRRDGGRWTVNERWTAPMLVGAAGFRCPVARMLNGPVTSSTPLIVAREIEFMLDGREALVCPVRGNVAEIYFTEDLLGYGWCVRKGDVMNVGIGRFDRRLPVQSVEDFASFVRVARGVPVPDVGCWPGHAYVAGEAAARRRTDDGVLLIGDAAGLASDRSGEGIGPAVGSALLAADIIVRAGADFGASQLARYDAVLAASRPAAGAWSALGRAVPASVGRMVARQLLRMPSFVRHVVLDRWFLHGAAVWREAA